MRDCALLSKTGRKSIEEVGGRKCRRVAALNARSRRSRETTNSCSQSKSTVDVRAAGFVQQHSPGGLFVFSELREGRG